MFFLRLSLRLFPRLSLNVARHMLLLIKLAILLFFHLMVLGVLNLAGGKKYNGAKNNLLFSDALCCVAMRIIMIISVCLDVL